MNRFTNQELADMYFLYVTAGESDRRARQVYENRYPDRRIPQHQMFARAHRNLCKRASVVAARTIREQMSDVDCQRRRKRERVLQSFEIILIPAQDMLLNSMGFFRQYCSGYCTSRALFLLKIRGFNMTGFQPPAQLLCVSMSSTTVSFDSNEEFRSCQVIYSQFGLAIHQNDHQARRRFVEWAQKEIVVVPDFNKRILFSDEAHFWLNGYVNKQNCRIWSEANPQVHVETPLHPEKLTVWCALWAGGILLQKR
ncbi:hypothetical protein TNCV_2787911 [Trichonephila clavipes]|uniref:DUF4817 domain-containing protein n=1 Tax=Trichonephila clavipes TaxID=2585209 RepID=A0A8X6SQY8_TRICX|nr:hypothetical protein TNCV_2787911 [Trichonephila clavipes]